MKPTRARNVSFSRQRNEPVSVRSFDARVYTPGVCGHELLPILSRDLGSDEIRGWECIFCNERFENYSAARRNKQDAAAVFAT
jgi:hypothetical protein